MMVCFDFARCASLNKMISMLLLLLFLSCSYLNALIVGSNTAVSRQSSIIFPSIDSDNEMRGFAVFEKGFTIEDSSTTCSYNDFFPVSGDIYLNSGTLILYTDFVLSKTVRILTGGTINGQGYRMELPPCSGLTLPVDGGAIQTSLTLIDQDDTGGDVYSVAWTYDDQYFAVGRVYLGFADNEIKIYYFDGSSMTLTIQANPDYNVMDVSWHPTTYYLAAARIEYPGEDELYIYYLDVAAGTFNKTDGRSYAGDAAAVSWHPSGNYLAVGTHDDAQEIIIYSFSTATGALSLVTSVNLTSNQDVWYGGSMDWDPGGNYLAVGVESDASTAPELLVYYFDGSTLTLTVSSNLNRNVQGVDWLPTGTFLAIGLSAGTESVRVYEHNVASGTFTERTSARIGETIAINSVHWRPNETFLTIAKDVDATGQEFEIYSFNKSAMTLTYANGDEIGADVDMARWSHGNSYIGIGDYTDYASIYGFSVPAVSGFIFNDVNLIFNADVYFQRNNRFSGNCLIDGRLHELVLDDGIFQVDNGSLLFLKNVTINGVDSNTFYCLDDNGTFSFQNATLILDGDLSFSLGHFDVVGDTVLTGTHLFIYQSDQVSNIGSNATLHFDSGMTFSYASTSARNLITMEDATAALHLNEATLYSVAPGLQLTKGTLIIEGECVIESDATTHDDGITLGDGSSASNNVTVKILPESGPKTESGWLNYKNVG